MYYMRNLFTLNDEFKNIVYAEVNVDDEKLWFVFSERASLYVPLLACLKQMKIKT